MTPIQQLMLGVGAKKKVFLDDVFSTYLHKATGSALSINNGIDLSGEGGLVWIKERNGTYSHNWYDTERGVHKPIYSNLTNAEVANTNTLTSFNSNGFSLGTQTAINNSNNNYASWTFRKAPGFFDVVKYTGNGSTRNIGHSLKSIPGMIIIKALGLTENWYVWHRDMQDANSSLKLNANTAEANNYNQGFGGPSAVLPTATNFTVGNGYSFNNNGSEYIAYVFAGGESTAATARSVLFAGNASNGSSQYSFMNTATAQYLSGEFNFGTNDFTFECWVKPNSLSSNSGNKGIWGLGHGSENLILEVLPNGKPKVLKDDSTLIDSSPGDVVIGQWTHIAVVRHSNTINLYLNGIKKASDSLTASLQLGTQYESLKIGNRKGDEHSGWRGHISNFRVVKGTAVYTSSFRPPTEPLTAISGTVLLACQNSAVNVATVWPDGGGSGGGTTPNHYGNETASSDSPFDDPAGFKFGEKGNENVIKCGSVELPSGETDVAAYLGFEPQWLMFKQSDGTDDWDIYDTMRGWLFNKPGDGSIGSIAETLEPNTSDAEANRYQATSLRSTGFHIDGVGSGSKTFIYVAIRRPDPLVQKPQLATDVFAMDTGNSSSAGPVFDSGFAVDFALQRYPALSEYFIAQSRLQGLKKLSTGETSAESTQNAAKFDYNDGWAATSGWDSEKQSWMWKRSAGFDVVSFVSVGGSGTSFSHSLGRVPEMMWFKNRDRASTSWFVYHKDLNASNPEKYKLELNDTDANTGPVNDYFEYSGGAGITATTASGGGFFETGGASGENMLCLLFASVDGISKVGSYTGTASTQTITTGFQPRFLIIKNINDARSWQVLDTTRGWGSGNDQRIYFNLSNAQNGGSDVGAPTSTGFTVTGNDQRWNISGDKYIYYAHA